MRVSSDLKQEREKERASDLEKARQKKKKTKEGLSIGRSHGCLCSTHNAQNRMSRTQSSVDVSNQIVLELSNPTMKLRAESDLSTKNDNLQNKNICVLRVSSAT